MKPGAQGRNRTTTLRFSVSVASFSTVCSTLQHLKNRRSSAKSLAGVFLSLPSRLQQSCKASSRNEYRIVVNQAAVTIQTDAGEAREADGVAHCEPHKAASGCSLYLRHRHAVARDPRDTGGRALVCGRQENQRENPTNYAGPLPWS